MRAVVIGNLLMPTLDPNCITICKDLFLYQYNYVLLATQLFWAGAGAGDGGMGDTRCLVAHQVVIERHVGHNQDAKPR